LEINQFVSCVSLHLLHGKKSCAAIWRKHACSVSVLAKCGEKWVLLGTALGAVSF